MFKCEDCGERTVRYIYDAKAAEREAWAIRAVCDKCLKEFRYTIECTDCQFRYRLSRWTKPGQLTSEGFYKCLRCECPMYVFDVANAPEWFKTTRVALRQPDVTVSMQRQHQKAQLL